MKDKKDLEIVAGWRGLRRHDNLMQDRLDSKMKKGISGNMGKI